jgi:hypothetical protein
MSDKRQLTFIDFFAGIGGFRHGLELAGMKCVGFCENDKFAVKSYRAMYDTEGEWYGADISKLGADDVPQADIWTAGSPCQNVSIAGTAGLHGDRSGLFFQFVDLLKGKRKRINPNGLSLKMLRDFFRAMPDGTSLNISVNWPKLGTIASGRFSTAKTTESLKTGSECTLLDILEAEADEKYYLSAQRAVEILSKL